MKQKKLIKNKNSNSQKVYKNNSKKICKNLLLKILLVNIANRLD